MLCRSLSSKRCENTAPTSRLLLFLLACIAHPYTYNVKDSPSCPSVPSRLVTAALGGLLLSLLYLQSNVRIYLRVYIYSGLSTSLFFYCLLSVLTYVVTVFLFCFVSVVAQSFFNALRKHGTDFTLLASLTASFDSEFRCFDYRKLEVESLRRTRFLQPLPFFTVFSVPLFRSPSSKLCENTAPTLRC